MTGCALDLTSSELGTSMAIVFTLKPEIESEAKFCESLWSWVERSIPGVPLKEAPLRKFNESNAAPRSIKKGSSTVPAKTRAPFDRVYIPCLARGVDGQVTPLGRFAGTDA